MLSWVSVTNRHSITLGCGCFVVRQLSWTPAPQVNVQSVVSGDTIGMGMVQSAKHALRRILPPELIQMLSCAQRQEHSTSFKKGRIIFFKI